MDSATVAHRWANKDFGKNGTLTASSCHSVGRNYFSYSTVFGQWLDISKNVVAIFDGATSSTSSKHKLYKGMFPDYVHVFPLDFGSGYGWHNCNLVSSYNFKDEDFKEYHRMQMIGHYVERMYDQFAAINGGKKKGLENVSFEPWGYIVELCSLYKDTSINKYLKWSAPKKDLNKTQKELINRQRKLVRMLKDGERNVETLTDALFGEGTFKKYWEYCARYRKAADKRAKVEALCKRLGIASPYESCWRSGRLDSGLTADQIRNLTAKERIDLHFASIFKKEHDEKEVQRRKKYDLNFRNAYKWIVGCEPKKSWCGYESTIKLCVNKGSGVVYECSGEYISRFYWCYTSVLFDYDSFRKSEDKEQWIADFYAKCKEVADNRKAISILRWAKANTKPKKNSWDEDAYILDEKLTDIGMDDESLAIVSDFIRRQDKHFADKEARRRAEEIERLRRQEERKREEEYRQQVKQEDIEECLSRGIEGRRDLWRKHQTTIYFAEDVQDKNNDYYYGGNVLLRLNLNKDKVETSKNIRMPLDVAKKFFRIIQKWHENPKSFKPMEIDTKGSGKYTISSYKNDILTAGCHKIAYAEMERMYNEIIAAV